MQWEGVQRAYEVWQSDRLGRQMEFLWFGTSGFPIILFPTSMGKYVQYEDMGLVERLAHKVDAGLIQLICVDSVDAESWYNENVPSALRGVRHAQYDAYLRYELIPYIQTRAQRPDLGVFGCSFGAYHAANLAGRYPGIVTKAVCFSGLNDIHRFLDGYWDDIDYYNCPTAYIANMDSEWSSPPASTIRSSSQTVRSARCCRRRESPTTPRFGREFSDMTGRSGTTTSGVSSSRGTRSFSA